MHRGVLDGRLDARTHGQPVRTPERTASAGLGAKQRAHQTVLAAGGQLERDLDPSGDTLDEAQQLVRRVEPERVAALTFSDGQRVDHAQGRVVRDERRLDHKRPGKVAPPGREPRHGRERQCPAAGSSNREKTPGLSKRGRQSQSIEPSRLTSAAELQSDSRP